MSKATPKKFVWRVVSTTLKSLDVVAETEHEAIALFHNYADEGSDISQQIEDEACYDIEAYTIKQKPVRHKKGVYNES